MGECLNCGSQIENTPGRRPKKFCDNKGRCRNEWHRKNKPKKVKPSNMIELPKDFIGVEKIGIIKPDGTIEELTNIDQLPETWMAGITRVAKQVANDIADFGVGVYRTDKDGNKTHVDPLSEEGQKAMQSARPKNLMELKAMCPFPEGSDQRRTWISTERQKYGI